MTVVVNSPQSTRVLVTGGSRGIGFEVARDLAASGHRLWLAASSAKVREAAAQLGPAHRASCVDIADPHAVASLFTEIRREWPGLDAVIHSAAELGQAGNFWEMDSEKFAHTLRVNSAGAFFIAKNFVQLWLATAAKDSTSRGKIVLFAGGGAGYGDPQILPHGPSSRGAAR